MNNTSTILKTSLCVAMCGAALNASAVEVSGAKKLRTTQPVAVRIAPLQVVHPEPVHENQQGAACSNERSTQVGRTRVEFVSIAAQSHVDRERIHELGHVGLDQRQGFEKVATKSGVGGGQGAVQLTEGLLSLGRRFGVDQVRDRLGLSEVHSAVLERATGELTGLRRP